MTDDRTSLHATDAPEDGWFPQSVAAGYDDGEDSGAAASAVDFLAALADGGPALELAVGTGRIALPLAGRGVPVTGIDLSRAMVARLRAKPGGAELPVTIGDMTTTVVEGAGTFTLAYLVYNTINNLTTQDAQVDAFRNAAAHLAPGGRFVVEVGVPELRRLPPGQEAVIFGLSGERVAFDRYEDLTRQRFSSHYVTVGADGRGSHRSIPFRYVWPAELDLMARLAGMRLEQRYEDWERAPFTSESGSHVSVYGLP
ncbi:class I SAM-dependent DNA methyltransferase [Streptomyces sp. NPDC102406]|uniref:class I SAM-dependent DNA methyltransferase n=1 Tax=Streptomyces sp. NPDC102406 TaxID=3366171 RepID=UPI00382FBB66